MWCQHHFFFSCPGLQAVDKVKGVKQSIFLSCPGLQAVDKKG